MKLIRLGLSILVFCTITFYTSAQDLGQKCMALRKKCTAVANWFEKKRFIDVSVSIIEYGGENRCYLCGRCSGWEDECVQPCCDPDLSKEPVKGVITMKNTQGRVVRKLLFEDTPKCTCEPCHVCKAHFHSRKDIERSRNFAGFHNVNPSLEYFYMCRGKCEDSLTCRSEESSQMGYWSKDNGTISKKLLFETNDIHCSCVNASCLSSPCVNDATCTDNVNSYTCTCANGYIGTNCETEFQPSGCDEIRDTQGGESGVYTIYLGEDGDDDKIAVNVSCVMETATTWTVFQRRMDGSVDFYLGWNAYEDGFGDVSGEHWLGNKYLYMLTSQNNYSLRIDMDNFEGESRYAEYSTFNVDSDVNKYKLNVGGYSGNAGDSFTHHNGREFSTKDQENDPCNCGNCAVRFHGAWWYTSGCHQSNLNGLYLNGVHGSHADGVNWYHWMGFSYSLKFTEMKMARK